MKKIGLGIGCIIIFIIIYRLIPSASWEIRNTAPAGENLICFGDSLTYGTGAMEGMDYPSQLSRLIGRPVVNAGVPGNTTATALKRIDEILEKSPRIVLITLGGNDLKNRVPKGTAFGNLKVIIEKFQDKGALIILGGIDVPLYGRAFAEAYKELAAETGSVLVPNVFEGIMGKSGLMSDPIHPNNAGYTIMAQHFYEALKPYL
ncbi:MAG: arylesterase [Pseudomonadota bacterium]